MTVHGKTVGVAVVDGTKRVEHLQLFVSHCVGFVGVGRLHRHETQQLQDVVLHHVSQRTGLFVVRAAGAHADALGHGDLHMVDVRAVPEGLEQRVGEAERHQVLDRFLAQVMVDAEHARLVEYSAHRFVGCVCAREVVPEWLFDDDTTLGGRKSRGADSCTDGGDKLRCHSQVECPDDIPTGQHSRELCPAIFREGIDLHVGAHRAERFGRCGRLVAVGDVLLDARRHLGSRVLGGDSGDAGGDDAAACGTGRR